MARKELESRMGGGWGNWSEGGTEISYRGVEIEEFS